MSKILPAAHVAALMATAAPAAVLGRPRAEAGADPEKLLRDVQASLDALNGEIKSTAETALKQSARAGDVSAETKAVADRLLSEQTVLAKAVDKLTAELEGVRSSNLELAQVVAAGPQGPAGPRQTLGQAVVAAGEDQIRAFLSNGAKGSFSIGVQNAITTAGGSGGGLIFPEEERDPVRLARRTLRVVDLIQRGRMSTDRVPYVRQTLRTDAVASIAETGTYPESAFGYTKVDALAKKIGTVTNISEEALADADMLQSEIDGELRYLLDLETEQQVLAGDGLGENLSGLLTNATAFAAAPGLPNADRLDRLRLAFLQITLADYVATGVVLNPTDWAGIETIKETSGAYVFTNPATGAAPAVWGKSVVESNTMAAGDFLAGDFMMAATLYDRSDAEVLISSEHGTNFVEDMLTMKARKRMALAVKRTAALVKGDFTFP